MTEQIKNLFTEHTTEVGESYFYHMFMNVLVLIGLVGTFVTVLIHAILPFAFVNTSRECIKDILVILNRNGDER